jgi:hypothetical protein
MAALEFVVHLARETYRPNVGWACPALSLPSAQVLRLAMAGRVLRPEEFLVLDETVRIAEGIEVRDAALTIAVTRRLTTARSSLYVAVAAVLVALGAVASAYHATASADRAQAP